MRSHTMRPGHKRAVPLALGLAAGLVLALAAPAEARRRAQPVTTGSITVAPVKPTGLAARPPLAVSPAFAARMTRIDALMGDGR